jgi:hypothetical protein
MSSRLKVSSKSLGTLYQSKKTKPRSPDITGKLRILEDTLKEIINNHREEDGEVYEANIAGWFNNDHGQRCITVELSPLYRPRVQSSENDMKLEEFYDEISGEQKRKKSKK